jgi:hypothetical protein
MQSWVTELPSLSQGDPTGPSADIPSFLLQKTVLLCSSSLSHYCRTHKKKSVEELLPLLSVLLLGESWLLRAVLFIGSELVVWLCHKEEFQSKRDDVLRKHIANSILPDLVGLSAEMFEKYVHLLSFMAQERPQGIH